ncbi:MULTISPECIES: hypothetical protein [Agrobacterium]|uniref:hypothetical protein n=1 Tax=Agrobacterium TaxID=357 RepID=UPI0004A0378B|nr:MULTISPECIES: hypothetical protein [Agrobacterium]KDR89888.1 hypothetical protein K538_12040 [Agrobacterium tumefaciens GW4]KVK43420.1 hypothetical protein L904_27455 [Agrobacterium sp. LY4]KVK43431.1 hypothetical protein L903_27475 [Agrobacterium sp. JL28]
MSIDTHSPSVAGFRCEAVTTDTIALPCLHSRLANIPPVQSDDVDRGSSYRDDPAVLIGLALAFVRQGPLLDGLVPEPLMLRLRARADGDNAACRLLLDWLGGRNRDLDRSRNEHLSQSVSTGSSDDAHPPRRSPRERVLVRIPRPGAIDGRRRGRTRPRDPVQNAQTAIIAAETGGRIDG